MEVKQTGIEGLVEIIPDVYPDSRGWFLEFYKESAFHTHGITQRFIQDNQSFTKKGVIRGLHMQLEPYAQAKLVYVISGKVLDVVVDLRRNSKTFGKVFYCELDGEKHNLLFVPEGFAHGFAALEDSIFFYKCSSLYNQQSETGIIWNDKDLKIDWQIENPILSGKDLQLPTFDELLRKSLISRH
ncbi:MAG: dTDP-4-dehydrorhamnose 3,5-epimerase [Cyclobacteriaceae bacterium]|nr:dTDP-4-dehydrorhamnose 3,5-epimerase [Cyclobacteriaceae bacterium]